MIARGTGLLRLLYRWGVGVGSGGSGVADGGGGVRQPLVGQVRGIVEAMEVLGTPLPEANRKMLEAGIRAGG